MNGTTKPGYPHWWGGSLLTVKPPPSRGLGHAARALALAGSREAFIAGLAAHAWRWAARGFARLSRPREPRNAQELIAYARTIEHSMPNLAAELRCLACRTD